MLIPGCKPDQAWKRRTYPVPTPSRKRFRWKASALRRLHRFDNGSGSARPATIMVPPLYNFMPAEGVAMGWLNEIDALGAIRQRMICAANITGWDIFTFHTLHNRDHYFDTTIAAVRATWLKEGNISPAVVLGKTRQFSKPYDYFPIPATLVEGRAVTALAVPRSDLPQAGAPSKPFWYSPTVKDDPILIATARDASAALETLNLSSWAYATPAPFGHDESVRGWLVSPLQPFARLCRWSVSNYLLANPASVNLFMDYIAPLGRAPVLLLAPDAP